MTTPKSSAHGSKSASKSAPPAAPAAPIKRPRRQRPPRSGSTPRGSSRSPVTTPATVAITTTTTRRSSSTRARKTSSPRVWASSSSAPSPAARSRAKKRSTRSTRKNPAAPSSSPGARRSSPTASTGRTRKTRPGSPFRRPELLHRHAQRAEHRHAHEVGREQPLVEDGVVEFLGVRTCRRASPPPPCVCPPQTYKPIIVRSGLPGAAEGVALDLGGGEGGREADVILEQVARRIEGPLALLQLGIEEGAGGALQTVGEAHQLPLRRHEGEQ